MNNTIGEVLQYMQDEVGALYPENEYKSIRRLIFDRLTDIEPLYVHIKPEIVLPDETVIQIKQIVQELKTFRPIQYIFGEAPFYGLYFKVTPDTLIPRPETEELVDWIIKGNRCRESSVLDIGTGSGCIAIALADNMANCEFDAIDISDKALEIAKMNAIQYKRNINFYNYDIFKGYDGPGSENFKEHYDVIVSNPPYVLNSEKALMHKNVLEYEPHSALFIDDSDPLIFYKAIADFARIRLEMGGLLYFEINEAFEKPVMDLLNDKGFRNVQSRPDINNKPRLVRAQIKIFDKK